MVVKVEETSWFSRMKNAIFGVLFGILMIPGSVGLLGWNEYRTIHRTQGLNQGAELVESIADPNSVDSTMDQKLVHLTATADTQSLLRDDDFHMEEKAIKLRRIVEMYQWVEHSETRSKKKLGGGTRRETTYSYEKDWVEGREDSSKFEEKAGHQNPAEKYTELTQVADHVTVGAYELNDSLIGQISNYESFGWDEEKLEQLDPELKANIQLDGEYVYWSATGPPNINDPAVGDQRIRFEVVRPSTVSLVAQQTGKTFTAFEVPNGEKIQRLSVGEFTAEAMFEMLQQENIMFAWILRALGLFLSCLGFFLIMSPLAVFADIVPFFGSMTRGVAGFVAVLLGICLSATTIAVSWIAVRPLISIPLLIVAVGSLVMLYRVMSKKKSNPNDPHLPEQADEDIPYVPVTE